MKANELRIGNLLQVTLDGVNVIDEIHTVEPSTMLIVMGEIKDKRVGFTPIPLTEEWLVKFGFDSINEDADNCNKNYTYTQNPKWWIQEQTEVAEFIFFGINNSIEKPIRYVHQLQNLYFALTGEELTLKQ